MTAPGTGEGTAASEADDAGGYGSEHHDRVHDQRQQQHDDADGREQHEKQ